MLLKDCFIGKLVKYNPSSGPLSYTELENLIGHIIGLERNLLGETILLVQWAGVAEPRIIHPNRLQELNND